MPRSWPANMARMALWLFGVRIVEHRDVPFPSRQTVFISNHTSAVDMFVIIALGLPNSRYFLSGFLRKFLPLVVHRLADWHLLDGAAEIPGTADEDFSECRARAAPHRGIGVSDAGRAGDLGIQQGSFSPGDGSGSADSADLHPDSQRR